MTILFTWGNPDPINLLILIVYAIMAIFMYQTLKEAQKQTTYTLAINQFNIFNSELQEFITEGKNIKFNSNFALNTQSYYNCIDNSNAIQYIRLFPLPKQIAKEDEEQFINDFRVYVLFPLSRYYDKIYKFILQVEEDNIMTTKYKNSILYALERDILQTYFRVCNNQFGKRPTVDFENFKTIKFIPEDSFFKINQYYIANQKFSFESLGFYKDTF